MEFTIRDEDKNIVDLSVPGVTVSLVLKVTGGSKKTVVPSLVTDGTDGKVEYTTISTDLDKAGNWRAQCIHDDGAGGQIPSTVVDFDVQPRI